MAKDRSKSIIIFFLLLIDNILATHNRIMLINDLDGQEQTTIDLINTCFIGINTIIAVGEKNEPFIPNFETASSTAALLVDNIQNFPNKHSTKSLYIQPPLLFVIKSELQNLNQLLKDLKRSDSLWSVDGQVIISNRNSTESDCNFAGDFLSTTWTMDILNVIYVCSDAKDGFKLFAYNPYTSFAPKPWIISKIVNGFDNHPWTLLEQQLYTSIDRRNADESIIQKDYNLSCSNLIFDRTHDLGNYPVKIGLMDSDPYLSVIDVDGELKLSGIDAAINLFSLEKMKASMKYFVFDKSGEIGYVKKYTGEIVGIAKNLSSGDLDLILNSIGPIMIPNTRFSGAFISSALTTISLNEQLSNMEIFLDTAPLFFYLSFLMIGLGLIFLRYLGLSNLKDINISNIVKVILGISLHKLPERFWARIILFSLIVSFFLVNSVIPGNFGSALTISKAKKNIEYISDLIDLDYRLFAPPFMAETFLGRVMKKLYLLKHHNGCSGIKLRERDACIEDSIKIAKVVTASVESMKKYHMPKRPLLSWGVSYLLRPDWPPCKTINILHLRMMSMGVQIRWRRQFHTRGIAESLVNSESWRPLHLHDFMPVFFLLLAGLGSSAFVLVMEIIVNKYPQVLIKFLGRFYFPRLR